MFIYAGAWAKGDSVALHSIPGYSSEQVCQMEGKRGAKLVNGTTKEYKFECFKVNQ